MTAFDAYNEFYAIKYHFTNPAFDAFKYDFRVKKANTTNFEKFKESNRRFLYEKLAKHPDMRNYILANVVDRQVYWIGDLIKDEQSEQTYINWARRNQALSYIFTREVELLDDDFNANFTVKASTHPKVLKLFMSNKICIETLIILLDLTKSFSYFNKALKDDLLWKDVSLKLLKYKPFLNYDKNKFKKIVIDRFRDA